MIEEIELQLYTGGYDTESLQDCGFEIIQWPESQELCELTKDWTNHCYLINDEDGLCKFGSAAYVVESHWYNNYR